MRNTFIEFIVRHRRFILTCSRGFAIVCFLGLLYLCYIVVQGRDDPAKRSELAQRIAGFGIPKGYVLSAAIYSPISRFALFTNPETNQRILLTHKQMGSERLPEGFKTLFWVPGKTIPAYEKHGGFYNLVVTATEAINLPDRETLIARGTFTRNEKLMEGTLALLRFTGDERSLFIVSDAPQGSYDDAAFREFLRGLSARSSKAL